MNEPVRDDAGVQVGREGPIATLTISRVDKHNAVTPELDAALAAALRALGADDAVRVVVLTGAGTQAFCTGADIPTLFPALRERVLRSAEPINFCGLTHLHPLPGKPLIAAVNGLALGGGFELALASDLRIASSSAQFGLPEPRWGVVAGAGGCTRVLHALPPALAADVLLAGRRLSAEEALRWGLVSRVAPPHELPALAQQVARSIADAAPAAIRGLVEFWRAQRARQDQAGLAEERALFQSLIASPAGDAGIAAFHARRASP
ncbi:MAG: enoyl-CoA hydratase/isomerase family protein [Ideonella sp.]|nr:enoyl-CoA hydratase/isomerase family protein [Ideonella sp.]MCC7458287.1 enoyl-CoA hydratase/isomerase family protein [Nitrospira sp.]